MFFRVKEKDKPLLVVGTLLVMVVMTGISVGKPKKTRKR